MYLGKKVSIVFPTYNEEENIRSAIEEFLRHPAVDEVVAVDNNSTDDSATEIELTSAKYVKETVQGYGAALRRGMSEATGDLIVTCEPDGTFCASDLDRLLVYSQDYDVVLGTRTSRNLVWSGGDPGANMYFALRMGNWAVAKFLEYLFNGPSFTDVGCTYKLIHRRAYEKIKDSLTVNGNWFSPEYLIRVLQHKLSVVEIPVQYSARIGTSKITGKGSKAIMLGFRMIWFIFAERLKSLPRPITVLIGVVLLLTMIPLIDVGLVVGKSWQGITPTFLDETFFIARVQHIVKGYPTMGNPYFYEHRNDLPLVIFGGAWLSAIPQAIGLNINAALMLNFILWSFAFAVTSYWLIRKLRAPPWGAVIGTVFVYVEIYAHVWRSVNLQTVYPFFFLFYVALICFINKQNRRNEWFLALSTAATFYMFAYLWQLVAITLGLLFLYALHRQNWAMAKSTLSTSIMGAAIGSPVLLYMLWMSKTSPYFWESMERLGLVHSHLPMAEVIYSGGWIGLAIAFGILVWYKVPSLRKDRNTELIATFLAVSGLGVWIMQGSNLITGKLLETGEHIRSFILPWVIIYIFAVGTILWLRRSELSRGLRIISMIVLFSLSTMSVWATYKSSSPFAPWIVRGDMWQLQQRYAAPFAWLDAQEKEPVVVWSEPHDYLSANLPIFTKHFTLYNSYALFELVSEDEIRERYLVSQYFNNPTAHDLAYVDQAYYLGRHDLPHEAKTIERGIKICKIIFFWNTNRDCGVIPTPQSLLGEKFFSDLEKKFQTDIKPNIKTYLQKYHVTYILKDKVLNPTYHPEVFGAEQVYSDERFEIYHL